MTYWYILAGIWTFLALCWTVALLSADHEAGMASKLERFIRSKEAFAEIYKREGDRI